MSFGQGIIRVPRIPGKLVLCGLLPFLALLATGCATVNVTNFESAIPYADSMGAGKISLSTGVDLAELFFPEPGQPRNGWDDGGYYLFPVPCLELAFNMSARSDGGGRFWMTLGSLGFELYEKFHVAKLGRSYLAVMPGGNIVAGFAEDREPFDEDECTTTEF